MKHFHEVSLEKGLFSLLKCLRNVLIISLLLMSLIACGEGVATPTITATSLSFTPPPLTKEVATPTPPLEATNQAVTPSVIVAPSPTVVPSLPTPVISNDVTLTAPLASFAPATGTPTKPDLSEHLEAMLPAFKTDLKLNQDQGAPIYNIAVRILPDPIRPEVAGHEQVIYTNDTGEVLDSLYFWLWANSAPPSIGETPVAVSAVRVNGQVANWTLENNQSMVRVYFESGRSLEPGGLAAIEMDFSLRVSTGDATPFFRYSLSPQVFNLCYWYPQVAVFDKRVGGWDIHTFSSIGDVTNSRTSFFNVWLTAPAEQVVVANGRRVERKPNSDGTSTVKYVTGPVRDFVAVLSSQYQSASQQSGETLVTAYFLEKDRLWGEKMLQYAVDSLKTYSDAFGQYPYAEYQVAETVLTTFGGLEFPGLIYITTRYFNPEAALSLEYVVAHETGHQWWYGLVGSDQIRHPFQDEGLTEYVPVLYFERFKSKAEAQRILQTYMKNGFLAAVTTGQDNLADQPVYNFTDFNAYTSIVYNKAGLFYEVYRQTFGEVAFLKFAHAYLQANRYKFALPNDLLEALKAGVSADQANEVAELYRHWFNAKEGQMDTKNPTPKGL
ncbi:MAG: hypothetical protein HXX20_17355 [Chloroflexi bacterium]|nr:hypothetical protein [Chloroflexota bacterium]